MVEIGLRDFDASRRAYISTASRVGVSPDGEARFLDRSRLCESAAYQEQTLALPNRQRTLGRFGLAGLAQGRVNSSSGGSRQSVGGVDFQCALILDTSYGNISPSF